MNPIVNMTAFVSVKQFSAVNACRISDEKYCKSEVGKYVFSD